MFQQATLLNPGPVNVTEKVRQALLMPDICHREEEFSQLLQQVRSKILRVLNLNSDYSATILTGSGTAALEAGVLAACYVHKGTLLVLSNGIYADRIHEIAQRHRIATKILRFAYNRRIDLDSLRRVLKNDRRIHTIAMTHHETSTGMLNPPGEIGRLAKQFRKIFVIDAISSLGADPIDIEKDNIDFCVGTAGKCFHAFPGLSFVVAKRSLLKKLAKKRVSSLYFDVGNCWALQEKGDVPFTPAVQLFSAFNAALDEFLAETLPGRLDSYSRRANLVRDGFERLGLKYLLARHFYSNTLTSLILPDGLSYKGLHDPLKKERFVIYAGQNQFKRKIFRIAHMGKIPDSELVRLLGTLEKVLRHKNR